MRYREDFARVRSLARWLIACHGKSAEAIALAIAATLVEQGQFDYAAVWQQVASLVNSMVG
jgi:mannose/fructose-specific phosphotransferase system component IIA